MNKYKLFFVIGLLLWGLAGCASMVDYLPPPPAFVVKIELNGPYDGDIPDKLKGQLRGARVGADWAVPYIFMSVGMHYETLGDDVRAVHFFDRSAEEFRKRQNTSGEGSAANRKVFALYAFGRLQEAFQLIREKEKNWTTLPMKAFVDYNYGHYYLMNGDYTKARTYFEAALAGNLQFRDDYNFMLLRRDTEFEAGIATILEDYVPRMSKMFGVLEFDAATMAAMRAHTDQGMAHLQEALLLNREIGKTKVGAFTPEIVFQIMEANVDNFLGLADGIKGNYGKAHAYLAESARLSQKAAYRTGEIDSLFFLNQIYLLQSDINAGRKTAEQLNGMAERYRFPFYQVWAKYMLSRYFAGFGNARKAIETLRSAVDIIEQQRSHLAIDVLKETYLFNRQVIYESLVQLLAQEGDAAGALEIAERAKSRVLVDLLAGKNIGKKPEETALMTEEKQIVTEITQINRQLIRAGNEQVEKELSEQLKKAEGKHRGVVLRLKDVNEELFSLVSVQVPEPMAIQKLLDDKTTLVDYFVTDSRLYGWVIQKDRIHLEQIKIKKEDLRTLAASFIQAIMDKDQKKTAAISQNFYDIVLQPLMPFVSGSRIGFIPHDALYYLPFAAMGDQGKYLTEKYAVFQLPNVGVFKFVMEKPQPSSLRVLALGNPELGDRSLDLPHAALEVESIKKLLPQTAVFVGKEATKRLVQERMKAFDVVHFATHGQYVPDAPLSSSLLLSPDGDDGRLTALEIFNLEFSGRGIVLSACQTALGASPTGAEITGLNRSFLYAGSPSVIATLWSVDDKATALFMETFYRHLQKNEGMADCLRAAQDQMIRQGYAPYYWAPFVLTGKY